MIHINYNHQQYTHIHFCSYPKQYFYQKEIRRLGWSLFSKIGTTLMHSSNSYCFVIVSSSTRVKNFEGEFRKHLMLRLLSIKVRHGCSRWFSCLKTNGCCSILYIYWLFKLNFLYALPSMQAKDFLCCDFAVANILQLVVVAGGDGLAAAVPTFAFVAELTSWVRISFPICQNEDGRI